MTGARILIVEDETIVARDIETQLTKMGFSVVAIAATGEEALSLVVEQQPDLVLMDIKLRGAMDGIETAREILSKSDIPFIYLTAHADKETLQRAKLTAPYTYVIKPIDSRDLYNNIDIALYRHSLDKSLRESEARYRLILRTAMDGFIVIDEQDRLLDVNDAFCVICGYNRAELLNSLLWDYFPAAAQPTNLTTTRNAIHHEPLRFEALLRRKDNHTIPIEISSNPLASTPNRKLAFAFIRDISDRKIAEGKISRLNSHLLRESLNNMRLYREEQEQRQIAQTLAEIGEILVSTLQIDAVLDKILEQMTRVVSNEICNIVLISEGRTQVVRSHGYEDFDAGNPIETFVFPLSSKTVQQEIIATGEPVVVSDVQSALLAEKISGPTWLRSYISAPIRIGQEVIGFLNVGSALPNSYTPQHAQRLLAFAHQAAIAFRNARHYEEAQKSAERLQNLSRRLVEIGETERRFIARELHDEIGQALTAVKLNLQAMARLPVMEGTSANLDETFAILSRALQQIRDLSLNLRPSILDDLGLAPALRWFLDRESLADRPKAQLVVDQSLEKRLPPEIELACFRLVQEAITNVLRHARAQQVSVELWQSHSTLHLLIRDDGAGFDAPAMLARAARSGSLGLLGMQERVALVGGQIEILSEPGSGTEIHVRIPISGETP